MIIARKSLTIAKDVINIIISLDAFLPTRKIFLNQIEYMLICCSKNRMCHYCYHNTYLVKTYSKTDKILLICLICYLYFYINFLTLTHPSTLNK